MTCSNIIPNIPIECHPGLTWFRLDNPSILIRDSIEKLKYQILMNYLVINGRKEMQ